MKWDSLINFLILYKSSIEHNIELLVILFYPLSSSILHATADDMPAKTEKAKVYIILRLASKYWQQANVIDVNVQLYVHQHQIPFKV